MQVFAEEGEGLAFSVKWQAFPKLANVTEVVRVRMHRLPPRHPAFPATTALECQWR
jgi:hypothetical protein